MGVALQENLQENLVEIIKDLPVETLAEVVDFAEFLREKKRQQQNRETQPNERVASLYDGQDWISDDFNDE
jgi:hypothetical protein